MKREQHSLTRPGVPESSPVGTLAAVRKDPLSKCAIYVERTGPGSELSEEEGWTSACEKHGSKKVHDTLLAAVQAMGEPAKWCTPCSDLTLLAKYL